MDYNKFKYEKKKKTKEALKKQREQLVETKEFRLSVNIDVHDFDIEDFLNEPLAEPWILHDLLEEEVVTDSEFFPLFDTSHGLAASFP